jgi:hypothetical protein
MTSQTVTQTRAQIFELARVLKNAGDRETAVQIRRALNQAAESKDKKNETPEHSA